MEQEGVPCRTLDQCANRRTGQLQDEIAFPVARHRAIFYSCGTFADQDLGRDEGLPPAAGACPRNAQCASRAQTRRQLASSRTTPLDV